MQNNLIFIRATAASSREQVLRSGLALLNESSKPATGSRIPPGVFFNPGNDDNIRLATEDHSKLLGEQEKKIPAVIELQITPENFSLFQGRINTVRYEGLTGRENIFYTPVGSFEDLKNNPSAVTIRLEDLAHEELIALGPKVGFLNRDGKFDYKPYKELSDALGIRAMTREEKKLTNEGFNPQMLK